MGRPGEVKSPGPFEAKRRHSGRPIVDVDDEVYKFGHGDLSLADSAILESTTLIPEAKVI